MRAHKVYKKHESATSDKERWIVASIAEPQVHDGKEFPNTMKFIARIMSSATDAEIAVMINALNAFEDKLRDEDAEDDKAAENKPNTSQE